MCVRLFSQQRQFGDTHVVSKLAISPLRFSMNIFQKKGEKKKTEFIFGILYSLLLSKNLRERIITLKTVG